MNQKNEELVIHFAAKLIHQVSLALTVATIPDCSLEREGQLYELKKIVERQFGNEFLNNFLANGVDND